MPSFQVIRLPSNSKEGLYATNARIEGALTPADQCAGHNPLRNLPRGKDVSRQIYWCARESEQFQGREGRTQGEQRAI